MMMTMLTVELIRCPKGRRLVLCRWPFTLDMEKHILSRYLVISCRFTTNVVKHKERKEEFNCAVSGLFVTLIFHSSIVRILLYHLSLSLKTFSYICTVQIASFLMTQ